MKKKRKELWIKGVLIVLMIFCYVGYSIGNNLGPAGLALMFGSMAAGMNMSRFCDNIDEYQKEKKQELIDDLLNDTSTTP